MPVTASNLVEWVRRAAGAINQLITGKQDQSDNLTSIAGLDLTGHSGDALTVLVTEDGFELTAGGGGGGITQLTGDVTAGPGSGSQAATIPNDTVTYGKMQNVSATSRFLGRITGGAGDVEELTAANAKTILSLSQADITGLTTADSPQFTGINLGHASDTTLTRVSAGVVAIEGSNILTAATGQPLDTDLTSLAGLTLSQGDILYRDATQLQRLAPGTSGQFLKTLGSGADPVWAAAASYGYEATPTVPDTSGYTLQQAVGGTASMANAANGRGIVLTTPTAADTVRFARKNGAPPSTPWSATLRAAPVSHRHGGTSRMCIILRNSTSGRMITFGHQDDLNLYAQRWAGYSTTGGNILLQAGGWGRILPSLRISNDGTTLTFKCGPDGDNFFDYTTEALATYINASGGSVDEVGFGTTTQNAGFTVVDLFQSFTVA